MQCCEAVWQHGHGPANANEQIGKPCIRPARFQLCGRNLCWVHYHAAQNPNRKISMHYQDGATDEVSRTLRR